MLPRMIASRAVASIFGVAVVALAPGCGPRVDAWNTALADLDCHASDTIVRKLKNEPGAFAVTACGEVVTYRCDDATGTCVADRTPSSAPVTGPGEAEPIVPALEGPAAPEEPAPEESAPEEPAPEAEPAPEGDATPEASEAPTGDVPEPP
jgi:hypothetical protein